MLQNVKLTKILLEGFKMKLGRLLVLLALVLGLLAAPWQFAADAAMLGRVNQMKQIHWTGSGWVQTLPDGSSSAFTLASGQYFVMTEVRVRFFVTDPLGVDYGPYRFFLLGPNSTRIYIANATDLKYPGSDTVWGGTVSEVNLVPGYVFSVLPTPQVQQMPSPGIGGPNDGPVRSVKAYYTTLAGYVYP
jgi:hypothetical protein